MTGAGALNLDAVRFDWGSMAMCFDLDIASGEAVAIVGPSGSGKTTLLNLIAGFERPLSGTVAVGGKQMAGLQPSERPVSMLFQENNLFAHLPALANVAIGIEPGLSLTPQQRAAAVRALARVGLAGKEKRLPHQLSGGERQRVALARVLVRQRPVLLLDEPFAALGPGQRTEMTRLIRALAVENGMTVLLVTHQPEDALALGGSLVFVEDGRITACGKASTLLAKRSMPPQLRTYLGA
jgi:thiamine transport system ATP-binding protein